MRPERLSPPTTPARAPAVPPSPEAHAAEHAEADILRTAVTRLIRIIYCAGVLVLASLVVAIASLVVALGVRDSQRTSDANGKLLRSTVARSECRDAYFAQSDRIRGAYIIAAVNQDGPELAALTPLMLNLDNDLGRLDQLCGRPGQRPPGGPLPDIPTTTTAPGQPGSTGTPGGATAPTTSGRAPGAAPTPAQPVPGPAGGQGPSGTPGGGGGGTPPATTPGTCITTPVVGVCLP